MLKYNKLQNNFLKKKTKIYQVYLTIKDNYNQIKIN